MLIDLSGLGALLRVSMKLKAVRSNHVISSHYYREFNCDTFVFMVLENVDFTSDSSDTVIASTLPFQRSL